jgi:membrane protease YdiL (CAAX protease family)
MPRGPEWKNTRAQTQREEGRSGGCKQGWRTGDPALWVTVTLAFGLWIVMFIIRPFNFWLMMSFSTSLLAVLSFILGRPFVSLREELTWKNILLGVLAAGILYAVFWVGNQSLILLSRFSPALIPDRAENLKAVYANRGILSPLLVGILLFFPIGFGEEVFWRGFVQRRLGSKWTPLSAWILTTLLYVGIHLPTGNPVLILAAFACGTFWGGLYMATGRLLPVIVSHMVWDPIIFVVWPIK